MIDEITENAIRRAIMEAREGELSDSAALILIDILLNPPPGGTFTKDDIVRRWNCKAP